MTARSPDSRDMTSWRVVAPFLMMALAAACSSPAPMFASGDAAVPDASPDSLPPPDSIPPPDSGGPDAAPCDESDLPPAAATALSFGADPTEGGRPPLAGVVELLDDRTAVFADQAEGSGLVLSLVALHPCRAVATDQQLIDIGMDRFLSSSDWSDR